MQEPPMMASSWNEVALAKLAAVVGRAKAEDVVASALRERDLEALGSPDDLSKLAKLLGTKGGFVAAVGGQLGVHAIIHGATDRPSDTDR